MRGGNELDDQVDHFLATGESDATGALYPAESMMEAFRRYDEVLRHALLDELNRRAANHRGRRLPQGFELSEFVRRKVGPMVAGLFPRREHEAVLASLDKAFVFLTRQATRQVVLEASYLSTAWTVANIYLASIGAECLGEGDWAVVGSCEDRCYVSMEYFGDTGRFADYVVHEAAHVFHNTKRERVGLPSTRRREWLLDIEFRKRETFAYACEVYYRILEQARRPNERAGLLAEYAEGPMPNDDRVDPDELMAILGEAVTKRNGWKVIRERCGPQAERRRA
ncbi:MAG: hypothetical protein RIF41_27365 [Polyangiaceae bacterium]